MVKNLAVNHLPLEALPAVQTWAANCKRDRKAVVTWRFAVCGLQFPMKNLMLKVSNALVWTCSSSTVNTWAEHKRKQALHKLGLILDKWHKRGLNPGGFARLSWTRKYKRLDSFFTVSLMCSFHDKSLVIITPSSCALLTTSSWQKDFQNILTFWRSLRWILNI